MSHTGLNERPDQRRDVERRAGEEMAATQMASALVVDDDQDTRDILRIVLEDAGYAVTEAADGVLALDALRASVSPLAVVLDLDLPRLDGLGVLRAVADDARLSERHAFVLLTAVAHQRYQAAQDVCAQLAVPLILKPFELDTLLDALAAASHRVSPRM